MLFRSYRAKSGPDGLFSIVKIRGKTLSIEISKPGYYTSKKNPYMFWYAGETVNFSPDASNPIVFHLRKVGKAEPITAIAGSVLLPKNDTPVGLSIDQAKIVIPEHGDLLIRCRTEDAGKRSGQQYDWHCEITVPRGGIQEDMDEFDFLAPESGYQASITIDMPATLERSVWRDRWERNYYLKLPDGKYAKLRLDLITYGQHFCLIEIYKNPAGLRSLEPAPGTTCTRISR